MVTEAGGGERTAEQRRLQQKLGPVPWLGVPLLHTGSTVTRTHACIRGAVRCHAYVARAHVLPCMWTPRPVCSDT